jgi:hypothetical protein
MSCKKNVAKGQPPAKQPVLSIAGALARFARLAAGRVLAARWAA